MFDLKSLTPYKQATTIAALALLIMLIAKVLQIMNITEANPDKIWVLAVTFGLFYVLTSCVFSLNTTEAEKYWKHSMFGFVAIMFFLVGLASLISGLSINETSSFRWIFIVIAIGYVVFSSIVRLMKGIVDFAQKEEWNQPKKRK